jgi:hypothetical protein
VITTAAHMGAKSARDQRFRELRCIHSDMRDAKFWVVVAADLVSTRGHTWSRAVELRSTLCSLVETLPYKYVRGRHPTYDVYAYSFYGRRSA